MQGPCYPLQCISFPLTIHFGTALKDLIMSLLPLTIMALVSTPWYVSEAFQNHQEFRNLMFILHTIYLCVFWFGFWLFLVFLLRRRELRKMGSQSFWRGRSYCRLLVSNLTIHAKTLRTSWYHLLSRREACRQPLRSIRWPAGGTFGPSLEAKWKCTPKTLVDDITASK